MADKDNDKDQLEAHEYGIGLLVAALGVAFVLFNLNMCEKQDVVESAAAPVKSSVVEKDAKEVQAATVVAAAPAVAAPVVEVPQVEAPVVALPEVKIPEVEVPEIELPEVSIPEVDAGAALDAVVDGAGDVTTAIGAGLNAFGQKIGDLFSLSLPGGTNINIPKGGFEEAFASDLSKVNPNAAPRIFDRIYFDPGSFDLDAASNDQIDATAEILDAYGIQVIKLRGHTDSTGDFNYNQQLSLDRATAVRTALIERGVVTVIEVEGLGQTEPADTNETEEGRRNNRRIDISVVHPE